MTHWLPRDPDVDRLLNDARRLRSMEDALPGGDSIGVMMPPPKSDRARTYSELIRNGDVMAHHLADMADSAFYERMRVPSLIARREPTPETLLPAWLRRPVNAQVDTWQG